MESLESIDVRRKACEERFGALLAAPALPFTDDLREKLPDKPGLYAIFSIEDGQVKCLHAGKNRSTYLRARIWDQHFKSGGKGAHAYLIQKVQDKGYADGRTAAQGWIRDNCRVQWVVVEDETIRGWTEHYILSILQPIWGS